MTTTDDRRREILEQVASGDMTPTEASERLAALDALAAHEAEEEARRQRFTNGPGSGPSGSPGAGSASRHYEPAPGGIRRVRVTCAFRSVTVVGDPTVHEAVADGDHEARIEGDTIRIDGDTGLDGLPAAFAFAGPGSRMSRVVKVQGRRVRPLLVRMNPALELDADVSAGSLSIDGVRGPINATCAAGSLRIDGFESPIDLNVSAGSVTASGKLDFGESHIQCDAGKVNLELERGSSVRITTRVNLGKVGFGGGLADRSAPVRGTGSDEHVVGTGTGRLDISCNLGSVQIDLDE